jgi:hypothetical protein
MATKNKQSSNGFVRSMVMESPQIRPEELNAKWRAAGNSRGTFDMGVIHLARYQMRVKYGVSYDKLPRNADGTPDGEALARLVFKKGKASIKQCISQLRTDGVIIDEATAQRAFDEISGAKSAGKSSANDTSSSEELGSRARYVSDAGRRPGSKNKRLNKELRSVFDKMEAHLDELVVLARSAEDAELLEQFRAARRNVILQTA